MFKHALTHDVTYHSLLVQRRKELHHLIGLAIEELYRGGSASTRNPRLSLHPGRGLDEALNYLLKAAENLQRPSPTGKPSFLRSGARSSRRLGDALSGAAYGHPQDKGRPLHQFSDLERPY